MAQTFGGFKNISYFYTRNLIDNHMHYPSSEANASEQKEQRIHLRHNLTPAEALLWRALKGRGVGGLKFRRQQGIGPFVLDFYCPEARLCVELDGSAHDYRYDYDERRTAYLAQQGIRVIRFTNDQVFTCLEGVVAQILRAAAPHPCRGGVPVGRGGDSNPSTEVTDPTPDPSPCRGGERLRAATPHPCRGGVPAGRGQ